MIKGHRARSKNEAGMTLMEMVVVMAVIAILAATLTPTMLNMVEDARRGRAESDVKAIGAAILVFNKDVNKWPIFPTSGSSSTVVVLKSVDGEDPVVGGGWTLTAGPNVDDLDRQLITNGPGYPTTGKRKWQGPYLERISADPWGSRYLVNVEKLAPATDFASKAVYVLSAGSNKLIETTFSQNVTSFTASGDDITFRIK